MRYCCCNLLHQFCWRRSHLHHSLMSSSTLHGPLQPKEIETLRLQLISILMCSACDGKRLWLGTAFRDPLMLLRIPCIGRHMRGAHDLHSHLLRHDSMTQLPCLALLQQNGQDRPANGHMAYLSMPSFNYIFTNMG